MELSPHFHRLMGRAILLAGLLFLAGCSLTGCSFLGYNRTKAGTESAAGQQSANVVREAVGATPITIRAEKEAVVTVNIPESATRATVETAGKTESDSSFFSKTKLPFAIALLIGSIGLLVLFVAVWLWRKSSLAIDTGYKYADAGLANGIRTLRTWATTTSDHSQMAQANALIAELESHRGKLKPSR
jgi:hypothetical protein